MQNELTRQPTNRITATTSIFGVQLRFNSKRARSATAAAAALSQHGTTADNGDVRSVTRVAMDGCELRRWHAITFYEADTAENGKCDPTS